MESRRSRAVRHSCFPALDTLSTQLTNGAGQLAANSGTLRDGAKTLKSGTSELASGAKKLDSGAGELLDGTNTLESGVSELYDGAETLESGSTEVKDGVSELKDGATELKDGMKEFDEKGTSKLKELTDGDLSDLFERIKALSSDDYTYETYSGRAAGMDGRVKFIIETAPIETEDE